MAEDLEQCGGVGLRVMEADRLDHRGARELAGGVTAETISNGEQPSAGVDRILVVLAGQASLRRCGSEQSDQGSHLSVHPQGQEGRFRGNYGNPV